MSSSRFELSVKVTLVEMNCKSMYELYCLLILGVNGLIEGHNVGEMWCIEFY
jgi:hypothetical protein